MQRYFETLADARGNVQAGLSVLVKIGGQNATIYSDNGATVQANPMTSDSSGGISFYAANGTYDLSLVAASGAVTALRSQIILFDPLDCEDGTPTSSSTVLGETGGVLKRFYVGALGPFVRVDDPTYGAVGNGTTDDRAAIQAAIAATPVGGTLLFGGEDHRINSPLTVNKSINIDFAGSRLILNNSTSPNNHHLDIAPTTDAATTWTEAVALNQKTFTVTTTLVAGDYVVLQLGTDPHDSNEHHFVRVCRIVANSGTQITIDASVPYAINGTGHSVRKITSLVANCTFKNLVLDYVTATVPDTSIYANWMFNVTFENIRSVKSRITLNPYECHNIVIRNVSGTVEKGGVSSHGRVLTMWQVENAIIDNVKVTNSESETLILLESWCRGVKFTNLDLATTSTGTGNLVQVSGGSYDISIDGYNVDSGAGLSPIATGGSVGSWIIDRLRLQRHPKGLGLAGVRSFVDVAKSVDTFSNPGTVFQRLEIAMQAGWSDQSRYLLRGVLRNLWVYVADKQYLSNMYVLNSNGGGSDIVSSLVNGQWVRVSSLSNYGSDYPFNDPAYPVKRLSLYTSASMVANTKLRVVAEYWPVIGTDGYLFPIDTAS